MDRGPSQSRHATPKGVTFICSSSQAYIEISVQQIKNIMIVFRPESRDAPEIVSDPALLQPARHTLPTNTSSTNTSSTSTPSTSTPSASTPSASTPSASTPSASTPLVSTPSTSTLSTTTAKDKPLMVTSVVWVTVQIVYYKTLVRPCFEEQDQ
ncbi:hypothetical protein HAV15_012197 [Penicillium sp. str. |nr:hypothetical protein HAV15_012197 [Penicillium sp. str. \